jgi:hypothetical protein
MTTRLYYLYLPNNLPTSSLAALNGLDAASETLKIVAPILSPSKPSTLFSRRLGQAPHLLNVGQGSSVASL